MSEHLAKTVAVYGQLRQFVHDMETNATTDWEDPLWRKADAQNAAIKFFQAALLLTSLPQSKMTTLLKPLEEVRQVLTEIALGGNPAVVLEALRPEGVETKQRDTLVHQAQAVLLLAYAACIKRSGGNMKPKAAMVRLDDELKARGMYDKVHAEHIQGWHNQLTSAKSRAARLLREAFAYFQPDLAKVSNREQADALVAKCLDMVHDFGLPRLTLRPVGATRKVKGKTLTTLLESAEFWFTFWRPVTFARSRRAMAR
jgi:hypothetical protein